MQNADIRQGGEAGLPISDLILTENTFRVIPATGSRLAVKRSAFSMLVDKTSSANLPEISRSSGVMGSLKVNSATTCSYV